MNPYFFTFYFGDFGDKLIKYNKYNTYRNHKNTKQHTKPTPKPPILKLLPGSNFIYVKSAKHIPGLEQKLIFDFIDAELLLNAKLIIKNQFETDS